MRNIKRGALLVFGLGLLLGAVVHELPGVYAANAGDVVINELNYNPGSNNDGDEFLELYNATGDAIDLSGWCFTRGITLCFSSGTTLAGHAYGVISPDATQSLSTYGVSTIGTYSGKLDNGGERITLVDESSQVIADFTYDDAAPWPTAPDGTGLSLELKDPSFDFTLASSWGASIGSPTPGAENSLLGLDLPVLSNVTKPAGVGSSDTPLVTVHATNADSVSLVYKVMFEAEQTIPMLDNGINGDVSSGDGVYSAHIPAQSAGNLVRYKVVAENQAAEAVSPSNDETINYYGYVVQYNVQPGALPRLEWFISDQDYADLNNAGDSDDYFPAVVAYGDTVIDNAEIRLKGNYSRTFPKKPYKVKLPKGYSIAMPEISEYPLKEFHLNSDFPNGNFYISSVLSWRTFKAAGFSVPQFRKIQLQRNGEFEGTYLLADKYDDEWQDLHPKYKTGDMYDAWWEDHNPGNNDTAARDAWQADSLNLTGSQLHKYVRDNYDIPNIINYLAVSAIIRHHDWSTQQNLISYWDSPRTQRWSVYPWDLDLTFNDVLVYGPMIDPTETPDYLSLDDRFFVTAIWNDAELKSMYLRRVRELAEQLLKSGQIAQWAETDWQDVQSSAQLDFDKWNDTATEQANTDGIKQYIADDLGLDPDSYEVVSGYYQVTLGDEWVNAPDPLTEIAPLTLNNRIYFKFMVGISRTTKLLTEDLVTSGDLPGTQPSNAQVVINEIMYNPPGGNSNEYLELYNPSNNTIDVSGWQIEGVAMTLPSGSVVPAHGYALVVKNDSAWKQQYGGDSIVLGEYSGALDNTGETIRLLRADTTVSDSVTYSSSGQWPNTAGSSLERVSEQCWATSQSGSGTPGQGNQAFDNAATHYTCLEIVVDNPQESGVVAGSGGLGSFGSTLISLSTQSLSEGILGDTALVGAESTSNGNQSAPLPFGNTPESGVETKSFNQWVDLAIFATGSVALFALWRGFAKHHRIR